MLNHKTTHILIIALFLSLTIFLYFLSHYYAENQNLSQEIEALNKEIETKTRLTDVYAKYGCTFDNPEITDNSDFKACNRKTYNMLVKEQESKFQEYVQKLENFSDELCPPFYIDGVKQAVTEWHATVNDYINKKCEAKTKIISSGSADIDIDCKIEEMNKNVEFLQESIHNLKGYKPVNGSCG